MNQLLTPKWRVVRSDYIVKGTAGVVGYEGLGGILRGLQSKSAGRGRFRWVAERRVRCFNARRRRGSAREVRPERLQKELLKKCRAEIQAHYEGNAQECRKGLLSPPRRSGRPLSAQPPYPCLWCCGRGSRTPTVRLLQLSKSFVDSPLRDTSTRRTANTRRPVAASLANVV
jgi:hypothetical protein